ncbi:MAG: DUF4173 domain-containing protein [Flavobacteriaceae bacterium]
MKHITVIIASILFSTLFYDQKIGLNLSIFSVVCIITLMISNINKFKNKTTIFHTIIYLHTAVLVFFQHTSLSILANILAFITLLGSVSESRSSIYVQWYNGLFTSIAGYFHRIFYSKDAQKKQIKKDVDVLHLAKLIGVPLVFMIVFIVLYKNGNPIFNDLISKINLSFINLKWILFTVLGYFLFSNIFNPVQIELATNKDLQTGNILHQTELFSTDILAKEKQLGTVLLFFLNILIVFYLTTDIISLKTINWSEAHVVSSQVHNGINALIASIAIAIIIILYFFRGNLNFYEENKILKNLAYVWIILNVLLVILITLKNYNYIISFGLTYKRIGVKIYLFLTLAGLITTFLKVSKVKNLWFLFRVNTQIAFVLLVVLSIINWDYSITKYNINHAQSLDLDYLITLSENNAELLNEYRKANNLSSNQNKKIITKYQDYLKDVNDRNWQEYTYSNFELKAITKTSRNHEYTK